MLKWKIAAEITTTTTTAKHIKFEETKGGRERERTIMVDGTQKRVSRIRIDNLKMEKKDFGFKIVCFQSIPPFVPSLG